MPWRDTLGNFLGNLGYHRLDYLNALLDTYLKEWGDYLQEFKGIGQVILTDKHPDDTEADNWHYPKWKYISVHSKTLWSEFPFQAYLIYSEVENNRLLKIRFTKSVNTMESPNFRKGRENELYNWEDIELMEEDVFINQDAVLEQLNLLLYNYLREV